MPLNTPLTYETTQPLAKGIAELLARKEPKLIVSEMPKIFRAKKVFIDWSQNADFKTTVGVYSSRAKTYRPLVSMPVEWDKLRSALKNRDAERLYFDPEEALTLLEERGDLFKSLLTKVQKLPRELSRYLADLLTKRRSNSASKKSHKIKVESGNSVGSRAGKVRRSRQGSRRGFAIQKHSDGHLHYDLSLEMNQMLKSWSLAKQLPLKEGQKQNALAIAEQPIEYLDFERIAPKGPEGRGTSIVWDIGTYELIEGNYNEGFLEIYLDGSKLNGEWTLVRDKDDRKKWQLEKTNGSSRILPKRSE